MASKALLLEYLGSERNIAFGRGRFCEDLHLSILGTLRSGKPPVVVRAGHREVDVPGLSQAAAPGAWALTRGECMRDLVRLFNTTLRALPTMREMVVGYDAPRNALLTEPSAQQPRRWGGARLGSGGGGAAAAALARSSARAPPPPARRSPGRPLLRHQGVGEPYRVRRAADLTPGNGVGGWVGAGRRENGARAAGARTGRLRRNWGAPLVAGVLVVQRARGVGEKAGWGRWAAVAGDGVGGGAARGALSCSASSPRCACD